MLSVLAVLVSANIALLDGADTEWLAWAWPLGMGIASVIVVASMAVKWRVS